MQKTQEEVLPTVDGLRQEATSLHFLRLTGDPLTYANLRLLFGHLGPHRAVTKAAPLRREKAECRIAWQSRPCSNSECGIPGKAS